MTVASAACPHHRKRQFRSRNPFDYLVRSRIVLVAFAISCGVLYPALLPLWEGFDEPFHYSYVRHLTCTGTLPTLTQSSLSAEIVASFQLAPQSLSVAQNIPGVLTYGQHLALSVAERAELRRKLEIIRPDCTFSRGGNYEAHQAPIAYAILAIFPAGSLLQHVLLLRIAGTLLAIAISFVAVSWLAQILATSQAATNAVLLCMFSSQMYWATIAHVTNDWLAVPLVMLAFSAIAALAANPSRKRALILAGVLSAGLLTKAYFLAIFAAAIVSTPLLARRYLPTVAALPVLVCGWWYWRNITLYGNITGMQESLHGTTATDVLRAATVMDWPRHIGHMAHATFWTGNNSFGAFSNTTVNLVLILLFIGFVSYLLTIKSYGTRAEFSLAVGVAFFVTAIAWSAATSYADSGGITMGASPWYAQGLLAPVLTIVTLGFWRSGRLGRFLLQLQCALWTWVLLLTFAVKLIPLYSGHAARGKLQNLWSFTGSGKGSEILNHTAMLPSAAIYGLTFLTLLLSLLSAAVTITTLTGKNPR
ncbi:MAG: hypothetical protein H7039_16455 [Bryobacteraceae bacterium]|nr:hypothetical protein [Bryobacteraceae bacterium]